MKRTSVLSVVCTAVAVTVISGNALGQTAPPPAPTRDFIGPEIPIGPIVRGAPYSADASTTVTQILGDGTRINRTVTAKLFRDSEGRVRREQTILGLAAVDPANEARTIVTIVDPVARVTYVLDSRRHRARRTPLALAGAAAGAAATTTTAAATAAGRAAAGTETAARNAAELAAAARHETNRRSRRDRDTSLGNDPGRAHRQRPTDRGRGRALGIAGTQDHRLVAASRSARGGNRVPADEHQPRGTTAAFVQRAARLHDRRQPRTAELTIDSRQSTVCVRKKPGAVFCAGRTVDCSFDCRL
jgi:hypothetical protein